MKQTLLLIGALLIVACSSIIIGSTVPSNGDQNPYGVAVAFEDIGRLEVGDILVSNFNDAANRQGSGTTIVRFFGNNHQHVETFVEINPNRLNCPGGIGLTTALVILEGGWVIVGSLPTNSSGLISGNGCLIVLDSYGNIVETIKGSAIKGPWDMTSIDFGTVAFLFVTNVLNGDVLQGSSHVVNQGNVLRITLAKNGEYPPSILSAVEIATGYGEKTDPNALIIGPTGVSLVGDDLFVVDTLNNRIAKIPDALTRSSTVNVGHVFSHDNHLNDPLGLMFSTKFGLVAANGGDSNLVKIQLNGFQDGTINTNAGAGGLFGLAPSLDGQTIFYVNDNNNTLNSVS